MGGAPTDSPRRPLAMFQARLWDTHCGQFLWRPGDVARVSNLRWPCMQRWVVNTWSQCSRRGLRFAFALRRTQAISGTRISASNS